jgi:8-oxo-dGTP pyrophosphatase MutT (NUDIX family)
VSTSGEPVSPATFDAGRAPGPGRPASVGGLDPPVPPQVIPRPPNWAPGDPPAWVTIPLTRRRRLDLDRVEAALALAGQVGTDLPVGLEAVGGMVGSEPPAGWQDPADPNRAGAAADPADPARTAADPADPLPAAVLVALFEEAGEARVLLTRRSSALRSHRGEVSFPGGRIDPGESPATAALREAAEEVALDPRQVRLVGWLHPLSTLSSRSRIAPVVGVLAGRPVLRPNPAEVERVFDVALADLVADGTFHEEHWRVPGRPPVNAVPGRSDGSFAVWFFEVAGEIIWGATARILHELVSLSLGVPAVLAS